MDISGEFSEIILQYNKNIQGYNDNMRIYLDVIINNSTINQTNQNIYPTTHIRRSNNIFESLFSTNTPFRNIISLQNTVLHDDVVITPTEEQISNATEIIRFNENISTNTSCPITLDPFIHGERVCRIKYCSHLFKENSLRNWFRRNVRCPICRYDIREYNNSSTNDEDSDNEYSDLVNLLNETQTTYNQNLSDNNVNNTNTPNTQPRNISNVTNVIRDFINNELLNSPNLTTSTSELLYTFDIPLSSSLDTSGSYLQRYF